MMAYPVLWQFAFSHFNEKVRWALDYKGIPHIRRSLPIGLHLPIMRRLTGQTGTPVLMLGGRVLVDSSRIIEALERWQPDPPLYPSSPAERARALDIEEYFDEEIGHPLRKAVLHEVFTDLDYTSALFCMEQPRWLRWAFRRFASRLIAVYRARADVTAESAAHGREAVMAALARIETERGAHEYLVGNRFSVADLAAAALCYPLATPPQFPVLGGRWPAAYVRYRNTVAHRPGFRWVAEMYRRHRGPSMAVATRRAALAVVAPLLRAHSAGPSGAVAG
jgi:glutathione S-transferase